VPGEPRGAGPEPCGTSRGAGGHPYYWGQIAKTPLMRGEIERCRQQVDNAWLRAEEARQLEVLGVGKLGALIRNRRKQRQRRRDRPMTPFVAEKIAERAAKVAASPQTTPPGQPKTDGQQAQSRPVTPPPPQKEVAPVPVFTSPSRQSWQDMIAKRREETRYAWQAADGTATGGRPR
jgi:hypothetical protein